MNPRIAYMNEKKLIGMNLSMNVLHNRTAQLWSQFSPRIHEIKNRVSNSKISMQIYESTYFQDFNPLNQFEKWAAVEIGNFDAIPEGMNTFELEEGLYAVFDFMGSSNDNSIFQYIFNDWLPNSKFIVDQRPHFEVLGDNYRNNDPSSEEEIWIPISEK